MPTLWRAKLWEIVPRRCGGGVLGVPCVERRLPTRWQSAGFLFAYWRGCKGALTLEQIDLFLFGLVAPPKKAEEPPPRGRHAVFGGNACRKCGGPCAGGLLLAGWGRVCWHCFQKGEERQADSKHNHGDGGLNARRMG